MNWIRRSADTWWAEVCIAGEFSEIQRACRGFCETGLCVTVTKTSYVYTYGAEDGAIIRLINYPRFPASQESITLLAEKLGFHLAEECSQGSFSVLTPSETTYHSRRKQDA